MDRFQTPGKQIWAALFSFFILICLALPAGADPLYRTMVKVIHADTGPAHTDPGLETVVREIRPVFKYTRFRLVKAKEMDLAQGQAGQVSLPDQRRLWVTPLKNKGDRIRCRVRIDARTTPVLDTQVMLKDRHSVTIGGPRFKKGVLLINIRASTR